MPAQRTNAKADDTVCADSRSASLAQHRRIATLVPVFALAVIAVHPMQSHRITQKVKVDSALIRAVTQAEAKFFEQWRKAWMRTMDGSIQSAGRKEIGREQLMSADEKRRLLEARKKDDGAYQNVFWRVFAIH